MKICLISASTAAGFQERQLSGSDAVRAIVEQPPVGILVLAAVLEEAGVEVSVVDLNRTYLEYLKKPAYRAERPDFAAHVGDMLGGCSADVFGFGTLCSSYALTLRIAARLRAVRKDAPIILGGPHASAADMATLESFPFIDAVVRGEAEETLPRFLRALAAQRRSFDFPGVTYRSDGRIVRNPDAPVISDLDGIPIPAYHYWPYLEGWEEIPLELGRGCPFGCTFCSTNDFFQRRYRMKSPEVMIRQMRAIRERYGISRFNLIHDSFAADRRRAVEFCRALESGGEGFRWSASARTDCLDYDLIRHMSRSGCRAVFFGIETGSGELQKAIRKNLDPADARRKIRALNKSGIECEVSLIIGFPEETAASLEQTVAFLNDSLCSERATTQIHVLAPLPGTPIAKRYGRLLRLDDDFSDISSHGGNRHPADLEWIRSFPEVFSNYYYVPTPHLERHTIVELREFVAVLMSRFRWLFVALHQDAGGTLPLFYAWRAWHGGRRRADSRAGANLPEYYASRFQKDFLRFLQSDYIPGRGRNAPLLQALLQCERVRARLPKHGSGPVAPACQELKSEDVVTLAPGVVAFGIGVDLKSLLGCLRRKGCLHRVPHEATMIALRDAEESIDRLQLSPAAGRLLRLCDGTRTVRQIMRAFAREQKEPDGIPAVRAAAFGLSCLLQQRLIAKIEEKPLLRKR